MRAWSLQAGLAVALVAATPGALGQKMNKCPDGKGGVVFQQEKCAESAEQADARNKERQRQEAEAKAKKDDEERRRQESIEKARERDKAYQEEVKQRQLEQNKSRAAEDKLLQGTSKQKGVDDGSLPAAIQQNYPGDWKVAAHPDITAAIAKNKTPGCAQYRHRQRTGNLPEYVVQCTVDKANWVTYFVWPKSETVRGPVKF